jgi:hypothetical protein
MAQLFKGKAAASDVNMMQPALLDGRAHSDIEPTDGIARGLSKQLSKLAIDISTAAGTVWDFRVGNNSYQRSCNRQSLCTEAMSNDESGSSLIADPLRIFPSYGFGASMRCADDDALHGIVRRAEFEVTQVAKVLLLGRLLAATAGPNDRVEHG